MRCEIVGCCCAFVGFLPGVAGARRGGFAVGGFLWRVAGARRPPPPASQGPPPNWGRNTVALAGRGGFAVGGVCGGWFFVGPRRCAARSCSPGGSVLPSWRPA